MPSNSKNIAELKHRYNQTTDIAAITATSIQILIRISKTQTIPAVSGKGYFVNTNRFVTQLNKMLVIKLQLWIMLVADHN